jgi:hypothetical protein
MLLLLILGLAGLFVLFPLALEWQKRGWEGTIIAKMLGDNPWRFHAESFHSDRPLASRVGAYIEAKEQKLFIFVSKIFLRVMQAATAIFFGKER